MSISLITVLAIIVPAKNQHRDPTNRADSTKMNISQLRVSLKEETIENTEELYSFLTEDLSDALTCGSLLELFPNAYSSQVRFSWSKSCEIMPPNIQNTQYNQSTWDTIKDIESSIEKNYGDSSKNLASTFGQVWASYQYGYHKLDRSTFYNQGLGFTSFNKDSYLDTRNALYDQLWLYRSRNTSREWLKNFAHTTKDGYLRTSFQKISFDHIDDLPINNTRCSARLERIKSDRPTVLAVKCYAMSKKSSESFLGATRRFRPQLTASIQFQKGGSFGAENIECLPSTARYLLDNINAINEIPPGISTVAGETSKFYLKKCGNSSIKLAFKPREQRYLKGLDGFPDSYKTYHQLIELIDKKGKRFEARPIFNLATSPCETKAALYNGKILIRNFCETQYSLHDHDSGSELSTRMLVKFLDMAAIMTITDPIEIPKKPSI